jgi:hypothetical protein
MYKGLMKTNLFITSTLCIASLLSVMAGTSFADSRPGWERPLYQADLTVLTNHGDLPQSIESAKNVSLVMTQQDGSSAPTGFVLLIDGQNQQNYQIQSISKDSCNSITYVLVPVITSTELVLGGVSDQIQMTDNRTRTCLDMRYSWEFDFKNLDITHEILGEAVFAGSPHAVMTPQ